MTDKPGRYRVDEYLSFDPDADSKGVDWVKQRLEFVRKTRRVHMCAMPGYGGHEIAIWSSAVRDVALFPGEGWKSCYFCIQCLDSWFDEWSNGDD
jgi:hypothetical protein